MSVVLNTRLSRDSELLFGDPDTSRCEADRFWGHEKAATRHALAAEAILLRVRALVSSGQQAEARALVAHYTRARPNDAYAKKLTELVGGPTP